MKKNSFQNLLYEIEKSGLDIKVRNLGRANKEIAVFYIEQITDKLQLTQNVIKPVLSFIAGNNGLEIKAKTLLDAVIYCFDCIIDENKDKIIDYILQGMTVIVVSSDTNYIAVNLRKIENRGVVSPELTYTIRGSRDSLNENIDVNLSLIRYRIKDENMKINKFDVGRRTKTKVAILHIGDIANESIVNEITKKIEGIDVDGILDSGEIQNLILDKNRLFPQMGVIERSDMAAGALLEGKVVVLVEGSALALVAPKVFSEFFESCDDLYDNKFSAVFAKFIRAFSCYVSLTITATYIAIISFHIDALPEDFILLVNKFQQGLPFTVFVGAVITEMIVEILREALTRVPKQIGPAIGIVGAIVIGQAAIAAKIFSPLLLIVASVSLLSTFTVPDYTIMNPLRIGKLFLILLSGSFGLIGFTMGFSIILINIISTRSFGIPYLAPFAPFNWYDFINSIFYGKDTSKLRPNFLKTKDRLRNNAK